MELSSKILNLQLNQRFHILAIFGALKSNLQFAAYLLNVFSNLETISTLSEEKAASYLMNTLRLL